MEETNKHDEFQSGGVIFAERFIILPIARRRSNIHGCTGNTNQCFFTTEMTWSNFPRNKSTLLFASEINYSTHRPIHIFFDLRKSCLVTLRVYGGKGVRHEIDQMS